MDHWYNIVLGGTAFQMTKNYFPCITATRRANKAFYILKLLGYVDLEGYMKVQLIPPGRSVVPANVSPREMGHAVGNGVHVGVVAFLFKKIWPILLCEENFAVLAGLLFDQPRVSLHEIWWFQPSIRHAWVHRIVSVNLDFILIIFLFRALSYVWLAGMLG